MCNNSCLKFGQHLTSEEVKNKMVLEIGALDVNGSLKPYVSSLDPMKYIGIDIVKGKGVDIICDIDNMVNKFGENSFDVVICTEVLEHVKSWQQSIKNIKNICKPGGIILITTRSIGFPRHDYPKDYWRYEKEDMERIFSDFEIVNIEKDPEAPGIFIKVKKPLEPKKGYCILTHAIYSMEWKRRVMSN